MNFPQDLESDVVAAILEAQFPDLAPARVTFLGEGCDSLAFEANGEWVFRFPKRAEVETQLDCETRMLPRLAPRLSLAIPDFSFHGEPCPSCPYRFAGYRKLPGTPAVLVDHASTPFPSVAIEMAKLLSDLHAFPLDEARRLRLRNDALGSLLDEISHEAVTRLKVVTEVAPAAPLARWRRYVSVTPGPLPGESWPPAVIHNDLAAEHILLDPTTRCVTGIIDWGDIAIGDPTVDFAGLFGWGGEPLVRAVLSRYTGAVDDRVLHLARYIAACKGVNDVVFGVESKRPEYVRAGLRALELAAGAEPEWSGAQQEPAPRRGRRKDVLRCAGLPPLIREEDSPLLARESDDTEQENGRNVHGRLPDAGSAPDSVVPHG